jgi:dolichol-phosphate mannosyltransferase
MSDNAPADLSLVIPCFNESEVLPLLRQRLEESLGTTGIRWEVIFVDDGSSDCTVELLSAMNAKDPRFKVVTFSRNFGHQAAVNAGFHFAKGKAVAVMDADLQDPPELLMACLQKLAEGFDVVYAVRRKRKEHFLKRVSYDLFYRLLHCISEVEIPLDAGDFCVVSDRVVAALLKMPERNIFMRGMRAWVGFKQFGMEYERPARAAGETKYPIKKLLRLATDGVFDFSTVPLRLATYLGLMGVMLTTGIGIFIVLWRVIGFEFMGHTTEDLPGWAGGMCLMGFVSAVQFIMLGIMGEYIGRIYSEVKQRPRWVIQSTLGLAEKTNL